MLPLIEDESKLDELYIILLKDSNLKYENSRLLNKNGISRGQEWFIINKQ